MIPRGTRAALIALTVVTQLLFDAGCKRSEDAQSASEATQIRLARNYGLGYLPMAVMQQRQLIEQNAKAAGLGDVKVTWTTLGGGGASTDALLSGSVDFVALGVPPHIILWAKSGGRVKAVGALGTMVMRLNTSDPAVKSLRDFTDRDRIAVPTVKISIPAVVLQMAARQTFGEANFAQLDAQTVSMKPPDAMAALLSKGSDVTANVAFAPYSDQEARDPRVHEVFNSYDVVGGPHTQAVLSCTTDFYRDNPRLCRVVADSLQQSVDFINANHAAAAAIYKQTDGATESIDELVHLLADPSTIYTTTPLRTKVFADFMFQTGTVKSRADSWKDLFFPIAYEKAGS